MSDLQNSFYDKRNATGYKEPEEKAPKSKSKTTKSDVNIYYEVARRLNTTTDSCTFFDDNINALSAAKKREWPLSEFTTTVRQMIQRKS